MEEVCTLLNDDADDVASFYTRYRDAIPANDSLLSHRVSVSPFPSIPLPDIRGTSGVLCPTLKDIRQSLANPFAVQLPTSMTSPSVLHLRIFQLDVRVALDAFSPQYQSETPAISPI